MPFFFSALNHSRSTESDETCSSPPVASNPKSRIPLSSEKLISSSIIGVWSKLEDAVDGEDAGAENAVDGSIDLEALSERSHYNLFKALTNEVVNLHFWHPEYSPNDAEDVRC